MKKNSLILISLLFFSSSLYANTLAYNGSSGIIEENNARVYHDFNGSISFIKKEENKNFALAFSALPKLEANFSLFKTEESLDYSKLLSLKVNIKKEGEISPSIVYGLNDIWGNSTYSSKYIALSKKIGYFDWTIGYIKGRNTEDKTSLGKSSYKYLLGSSWNKGDAYLGTEFLFKKNLSLLADYRDKNFNYGIRYEPYKNINTYLSFENSKNLAFGISYDFFLENRKNKTKSKEELILSKNLNTLEIYDYKKTHFYDFENLNSSIEKVFEDDKNFEYIVYKSNDKKIKLHKVEYELYQKDRVSDAYLKESMTIKRELNKNKINSYEFSLSPNLQLFTSEDSSLKSEFSLDLDAYYQVKSYFNINGTVKVPLYNSDEKNKEVSLKKLFLSNENSFFHNEYLNLDGGYVSSDYRGVNIEYQKIFSADKIALSLQYQYMQKRDDNYLKYLDKNYDAKFLNLYYLLDSSYGTHLGLKLGEFLHGDRGYRIDFSRSYNSFVLGAYYSNTDLKNQENKKGLFIKIPFYCNVSKSQNKIPVNLDSSKNEKANFVEFNNSLYNKLSNENNIQIIRKNIKKIYK